MTWTPDDIADVFANLEAAGLRAPPAFGTADGYDRAVRMWCAALDGIPERAVYAAIALHLRTPERCRFWPSVGDLVGHIPAARAPALVVALDPDEQAWERIQAVIAKGPDAPELRSPVTFTEVDSVEEVRSPAGVLLRTVTVKRTRVVQEASPFARSLTADQAAALDQLGGLAAVRAAEGDIGRAVARKRFLVLCREPAALQLEAPPTRPALPENAPAFLRLAFGAEESGRGAERARNIARAQGE